MHPIVVSQMSFHIQVSLSTHLVVQKSWLLYWIQSPIFSYEVFKNFDCELSPKLREIVTCSQFLSIDVCRSVSCYTDQGY